MSRRFLPVMNQVLTGLRPKGGARPARRCRGRRTSKAPACAGWALRSRPADAGFAPYRPAGPRCRTPKRCCSSTMARPRFKFHRIGQTAWVPTTRPARPSAMADSAMRLSLAFMPPTSSVTLTPKRPPAGRPALRHAAGPKSRSGPAGRSASRLGGKPDGRSGNERFAAADIALQKPVHRHLAAQVTHDLLGRSALRPGGRVRQTAPERPQIQRVHRRAGSVAPVAA